MEQQFTLDAARVSAFNLALVTATEANRANKSMFGVFADGWRNTALRNRELGLPLPEKKDPPLVIHIVPTESPDPELAGWPRRLDGPDRVADPIPDLEPLSQIQPSSPVGAQIGNSNWYGGVAGDTSPAGTIAMKDGVPFRKITFPFGAWWVKE